VRILHVCQIGFALAVLILLQGAAQPASPPAAYIVRELGSFSQSSGETIRGLSVAGELVGGSGHSGFGTRAFLLTNTKLEEIKGLRGADRSVAHGSNETSVVVGSSNTDTSLRAFMWTRKGGVKDLGTLPGDSGSEAFGINKHNQVVGYSSGPRGMQAVIWNSNGKIEGLGTMRADDHSRAYAINDLGAVVGFSGNPQRTSAFLWTREGGMKNLGALPGDKDSVALSINNKDSHVVGYSSGPGGDRGFLWTREGGIKTLGAFPGDDFSRAVSINDRGEVVGTSGGPSGTRAFLWTRSRGMENLNSLIPAGSDFGLSEAVAVNDQGTILAVGYDDDGHADAHGNHEAPARIFLLTPRQ
jgi:probable HAF family extracellular repeat protein